MANVRFGSWKESSGFNRVAAEWTRRPRWVWATAAALGLLPFAIVIAVLAVMALLVTALLYMLLSALHELWRMATGKLGGHNHAGGRRNVRVRPPAPDQSESPTH